MNKFERMFNPDGLLVPERIALRSVLAVPRKFEAPPELILDGYCTPVENQGSKPWCAAYSASNFAENVLWRVNGYRTEIDPAPIYRHAKMIDGDPNGDGTYLECALKGLVAGKWFDDKCQVRTVRNLDEVKYAVHRYGCCVAGFAITSEWFRPDKGVVKGNVSSEEGGHAVTVVGYDQGGVLILNSWGRDYGHDGKVYLTNKAFNEQFIYGAVLTNVLDGLK